MPKYMMVPMDDDASHTPTTQAQIMCEETMEATQGAMLTHTASYILKAKVAYELMPRWRLIARHKAHTELRGAIKLANHLCNVELMP